MNRRQAITAIAAAVPGLALAADKSIFLPREPFNPVPSPTPTPAQMTLRPDGGGSIGWTTGNVAIRQQKARIAARFAPDGCIEIPLDGWTGWRVTYAGESIDITPAEIMDALRGGAR